MKDCTDQSDRTLAGAVFLRGLLRFGVLLLLLTAGACPPVARAQVSPIFTIEQEVVAAAFAPDGRLVYAVRRIVETRHIEQRRDDIFLLAPGSDKPRRIVEGQKLVRGGLPFSFAVQSIRWSPDGTKLSLDLLAAVIPGKSLEEMSINFERGQVEEFSMTLLLDDQGKEIKVEGGDSVIPLAVHAAWLADGATVAYITEKEKPNLLFAMGTLRPAGGRGRAVFENSSFTAVAWDSVRSSAAAIERDPGLRNKPRLVLLDVLRQTRRELAEMDAYLGQLSISPSGTRIAYFRDYATLEILDVADPRKRARVKVAYGDYAWTQQEDTILMKRALEKKKGDLYWIRVPMPALPPPAGVPETADPKPRQILSGLGFRDFALAPKGDRIAVIEPGKRNLLIYSLE